MPVTGVIPEHDGLAWWLGEGLGSAEEGAVIAHAAC